MTEDSKYKLKCHLVLIRSHQYCLNCNDDAFAQLNWQCHCLQIRWLHAQLNCLCHCCYFHSSHTNTARHILHVIFEKAEFL